LGAQRLYYVGTATESFDPVVDVTGVRAYPLTEPATCAVPPEGWPPVGTIPCPLWSTPTAGRPVTSPVLGPGESVVYVGTADGMLLALGAADGHVLWSAALGAVPSADPALAEGWLYVPLADGDLVVLPSGGCGAATCGPAWRAHLGGAGVQPAVAGGVVFVGTDAGHLVALRAAGCHQATCHSLWQHDFGASVTGAPAVTGGRVYVGVSPDKVVALAPT
jgi:outer membrane protein assembly factor BamB